MSPKNTIEFLKGKVISDIEYGDEYDRFIIENITFKDGTVLELEGSCDYANICCITLSNGETLEIEKMYDE